MHNIVASGRGVIAILDGVTEHFENKDRVGSLLSRRYVYGATARSLSLSHSRLVFYFPFEKFSEPLL